MSELRVPFAIDEEGNLFDPTIAEKGKNYFCPACREPVIFRFKQAGHNVAHFAHKASKTCNQETITHKTAKLLVQKAISDWKSGKAPSPTLQRSCQNCSTLISQPLPEKVKSAILEYKLTDGSIADVALITDDVAHAAIEIRVAHAVDEIKANRLLIPFIELDGYEIIANPAIWKPITDKFKPITCSQCKSIYSRFQAKVRQIAKASKIEIPNTYYRYGVSKCWKCKHEIIVFAWLKDRLHDETTPKITPPRTVQYRYSKTVGHKYWVNTCPYCQSIIGDFFLYNEPAEPFFEFDCTEDSTAAFDSDMLKIAIYAVKINLL